MAPATPATPFVLAIGDSLTAGYGLRSEEALPARLQALLRARQPRAVVQNAGVSGDTTGDGLRRLPALLSSLTRRPDLAIVALGPNDLIRRVAPAATRANLHTILLELRRCAIPVLLASFDVPAFLGEAAAAYDGMYAALAAEHGATLQPFFPPGVAGHPAHVLRDRLHPNAGAIDQVARAMMAVIEELLR